MRRKFENLNQILVCFRNDNSKWLYFINGGVDGVNAFMDEIDMNLGCRCFPQNVK